MNVENQHKYYFQNFGPQKIKLWSVLLSIVLIKALDKIHECDLHMHLCLYLINKFILK